MSPKYLLSEKTFFRKFVLVSLSLPCPIQELTEKKSILNVLINGIILTEPLPSDFFKVSDTSSEKKLLNTFCKRRICILSISTFIIKINTISPMIIIIALFLTKYKQTKSIPIIAVADPILSIDNQNKMLARGYILKESRKVNGLFIRISVSLRIAQYRTVKILAVCEASPANPFGLKTPAIVIDPEKFNNGNSLIPNAKYSPNCKKRTIPYATTI